MRCAPKPEPVLSGISYKVARPSFPWMAFLAGFCTGVVALGLFVAMLAIL